ncbi:acyltransferase family protein [Alteromonas hispanica]|uniref:Acyltransferase family protein n=1 Tax=Alteromonas hispanica TaxID=315421 RepID=A0A6L9MUK2_9ALTE|nr:acyltransferase [Alteromonas hispanica]NDW21605.1 acyltransferase family protein [Alteromonas hispanica]
MNKETSLYLDFVRFISALVVFLGHAAGKLTSGFLWQLNEYLSAAVMVFFVLSGYVIAFVTDKKEKDVQSYLIARISRFSSVAIPALLLTALLDGVGSSINNELYFGGPWPEPNNNLINYVLSALFIQNVWGLNLNPGINVPFWSLSFEFGFYLIFAAFVFTTGRKRILTIIGLFLFLGPNIITYLPIWLMGVVVYFAHKHVIPKNSIVCGIAFIATALALVFLVPSIKDHFHHTPSFFLGKRNVLADYIFALLFSANLYLSIYATSLIALLAPFRPHIIYLASCSFSLYLFHRPLIQFFAALEVGEPSSFSSRFLVIGGTLFVVFTFGAWAERQKTFVKQKLTELTKK